MFYLSSLASAAVFDITKSNFSITSSSIFSQAQTCPARLKIKGPDGARKKHKTTE